VKKTCTVAIMAFNESESLENVVHEILGEMEKASCDVELLIINDGSSDQTGAVGRELETRLPAVRLIEHPTNLGLGEVYRSGFDQAKGDWLTFMPGDGQIPASDLLGFVESMESNDMVLGYIPDRPVPFYVKLLSYGERALYGVLVGKMPRFQGIMMFRRNILQEITLCSTGRGWTILMELILKVSRGDYRIAHAPTGLRERVAGESKVNNLKTISSNLRQMLTLRKEMRRSR
jgi:glycosyltransferase involved in cell wall biosynthesis